MPEHEADGEDGLPLEQIHGWNQRFHRGNRQTATVQRVECLRRLLDAGPGQRWLSAPSAVFATPWCAGVGVMPDKQMCWPPTASSVLKNAPTLYALRTSWSSTETGQPRHGVVAWRRRPLHGRAALLSVTLLRILEVATRRARDGRARTPGRDARMC